MELPRVSSFFFLQSPSFLRRRSRADTVLAQWQTLSNVSTKLYNSMSSAKQPAFFQLVQHPVQASYTLAHMWIAAGFNNLRASQAFLTTNTFADQVEQLFAQDFDIETQYHTILDGISTAFWTLHTSLLTNFLTRKMGSHDGSNPRHVLLLAATDDEHVCTDSRLNCHATHSVSQHAHDNPSAAAKAGTRRSHADCS